jgi:2-polyprenyl-3-methyl-5-hydroxy-6-metoxy-1,4-benzoquinol methylase
VIGQFYPDTYYSYQAPPDGSSAGGTVAGHTWGGNRTPQVVVKEVLQRSGGAVLYRGLKAVKTAALRLSPGIPEWVRKGLPPPDLAPGRILDVGCGAGHFLDVARARGWETWGADLSVSAVRSAAARGHRVRAGDVRQADFPAGSFDAVRLWQTLEHVHDPVSVLRTCRELLQPGGTLLLGVPNVAGRPARWFGPAWMGWDVPRHMWAFAPDTLTRLVRKCGLDTSDHRVYATPLLLGLSDHWKQGKTLETLDQSGRWTRLKWYWAAGILDRTGEGDLICLTARKKGAGSA